MNGSEYFDWRETETLICAYMENWKMEHRIFDGDIPKPTAEAWIAKMHFADLRARFAYPLEVEL